MTRWCNRRTMTTILLIAGAAILQGCVYAPYPGAYGSYPGYGGYGYQAYGGYYGAPRYYAAPQGGGYQGQVYQGQGYQSQGYQGQGYRGPTP
jgi:hypothetical protein